MAKICKFLISFFVCFFVAQAAQATNWYVSNAGSNSNSGTSSGSPFLTIAHAVSVATAHDTINLNGGNTFNEAISTTVTLSFQSYGTGAPTIATSSTGICIGATNCGLNVTGINTTAPLFNLGNAPGGYFGQLQVFITDGTAHSEGCTITNCATYGGGYGIFFWCQGAGSQCNNTTVTGCNCSGGYFGGIVHSVDENTVAPRSAFSNVYVAHNVVHDFIGLNFTGGVGAPNPMFIDGGNSSVAQCVYEYNLAYNCGTTGSTSEIGACYGIFTALSDSVLVQHNVCHDITTPNTADGGGWDIDYGSRNVIFQYNYAYHCGGVGFWTEDAGSNTSDNNVFRFNICVDCMQNPNVTVNVGYCAFGSVGHTAVYGNTFIGACALPSQPMIGAYTTGLLVNKLIYNNVFIGTSSNPCIAIPDTTIPSTFKCDYNYYQNGGGSFLGEYDAGGHTYSSMGAWSSATGLDTHSAAASYNVLVNPIHAIIVPGQDAQLEGYYSPLNGSVIARAGVDLSTISGITPPTVDIAGNPLNVPYSIGALAYSVPPISSYATAQLSDNPVMWTKCGDPDYYTDSCFVFTNGSLANVAATNTPIIPNSTLPSFLLNTSSVIGTKVGLGNPGLTFSSGLSCEYWILPSSLGGSGIHDHLSYTPSDWAGDIHGINATQAGDIFAIFYDPSVNGDGVRTNSAVLSAGKTAHVVAVWPASGNTVNIYVNGILQPTSAYTGSNTLASVKITSLGMPDISDGVGYVAGNFSGNIAGITYYGSALNATKVLNHFQMGCTSPSACVAAIN